MTDQEPYQEIVERLYFWTKGSLSSFSAQLFDLIAKADVSNRRRLALGFPQHVRAWEEWMASSPREFLARHRLGHGQ